MKALELVWPSKENCKARCDCDSYAMPYGLVEIRIAEIEARAKRFTPAELAAEDWRRKWTELRVTIQHGELSTRQQSINETMLQFIELPNYDEVP